jgi:type IV secretion system protein VirB2
MNIARGMAALSMVALSAPAAAASQVNPQGSGPIVSALMWLQGTLLGNVATAVAVIAVAMVGFMMLTGRMNWRLGQALVSSATKSQKRRRVLKPLKSIPTRPISCERSYGKKPSPMLL